ncbi:MAG: DUF3416 domain-containing protein [Proteobacteria bacterium]|nr:DUF3416 domain-containing protein [Pseudomonadota bacterium]
MNRASPPRACYIRPSLLGPVDRFAPLLDRCAALGFNTVVLPCPFVQDQAWAQARLGDAERLAPVLGGGNAAEALTRLSALCRERGLWIVLDVRLDQVAGDAPVVTAMPHRFRPHRTIDGALPDPRRPPETAGAAIARFGDEPDELTDWWCKQLSRWCDAGIAGFRCLWPQRVPPAHWHSLMSGVRAQREAAFWAWTPGVAPQELLALGDCGFDAAFSSLAWWDFQSSWYLEEDARLRRFAAAIAVVDDPLPQDAPPAGGDIEPRQRARVRAIEFAAATGDGLLIALEEDSGEKLDRAITEANATLAERTPSRRNSLRPLLMGSTGPARAWLVERLAAEQSTPAQASASPAGTQMLLVNGDTSHIATVATAELLRNAAGYGSFAPLRPADGSRIDAAATVALEPAEVRVYAAEAAAPVLIAAKATQPITKAAIAPRIAIEQVSPSVDGGRFAVKRTVGERVRVQADIFCDGHDLLAAAVLWRAYDERRWQCAPMRQLGNDRWGGEFSLGRLGRHEFTVEAWRDVFATARMDLEKKRAAGKLTALDVSEACQLVTAAAATSGDAALRALAGQLAQAEDENQRTALLVAPETAQAMTRADGKAFLTRCATVFTVDAERRGAGYSSWYELFPRSQSVPDANGDQPHGTFDDVIARLPAIAAMGFDVLYMPPIHPIGRINRKGRNNSVTAEPGEPGSPYAIGAKEGGHDAIHPELGTLEDFRRLVAAAAGQGLELALDFAIQCSPDHPWLREHPDWFAWRADGSIRYAENPPKKYEDIVNVDFYADGAVPDLWLALRDVVEFWVNEGVRLFRVDNPHTKPFPFWEWMIGDIRARHPDVVFLSEAFTRPRLMYRLAKIGFSQSYTYFTWRNGKAELTAYLQELADSEVRDYFRPHFFVNTPDINPTYLQTSGRAGHLVRAALATTLSGLWGMYSGFELCEATPLAPGKEEYLDSEKYQLRDWDWQRPGNIIAEITRLNLLRRLNPALQTHLGVRFYNAFNDHILYFGKRRSEHEDMVLVAVNLDPHAAHEADFELPLWEWGLPDDGALQVEDLWRGTRSVWRGKMQRMRLDPGDLPFAIWRVGPPGAEVA